MTISAWAGTSRSLDSHLISSTGCWRRPPAYSTSSSFTLGVAEAARNFLTKLDLSVLKKIKPASYPKILEKWTSDLKRKLPKGAKRWGTARKAINVFMVQVFLNKYLSKEYGLDKLKNVLETPPTHGFSVRCSGRYLGQENGYMPVGQRLMTLVQANQVT